MKPSRPSPLSSLFSLTAGLFFASGATALVYQVAWLRSLLLVFGSTAFAVATILTSFMAGLAGGAYYVGRWIDRSPHPLAVYGLLEIGIGLYALAVPLLLAALEPIYRDVWVSLHPPAYAFALLRFFLCFLVLLVPTAMMGGTLPALARFSARLPLDIVGSVGALYGVNTLGAFCGTLLSGFLLLPAIGLGATLRLTAAVNVLIGLAALAMALRERRRVGRPQPAEGGALPVSEATAGADAAATAPAAQRGDRSRRAAIRAAFALTGAAALVLEVAWTRVLSLVIGPSVYGFALMLAAFLAGLGLGSLIFAGVISRFRWTGVWPFAALSAATGALAYGALLSFHRLPYIYVRLFERWGALESRPGIVFAIGLVLSGAVMLPPTLAMGGLFPAALKGFGLAKDEAGRGVGGLYAANAAGAVAGAFAAGFLLIPAFGLQGTVLAAAWLYLAVAGALAWLVCREHRMAWAIPVAAVALGALTLIGAPPWNRLVMSSGVYHYAGKFGQPESAAQLARQADQDYEELFYREGLVSTVLVARERRVAARLGGGPGGGGPNPTPSLLLINNGKVDASSVGDMPTQVLSAHIPLLLHPAPRRALVIGLASGTTAGSALRHELESLDIVEIEPATVEAAAFFDFVNGRPLDDPRARISFADGRTYLLLTDRSYDVIISEPSNPWITGVSNLFTLEFFELARERLAEGGVFCQWVQMYGMSSENLEVLLRTFRSVFPSALVFNTIRYTDILLVGAMQPLRIVPSELERRLTRPEVAADLARVGITDAAQLLARGRLGPRELEELVGDRGTLLNTDDNARIEFSAPLDLYRETRGENERLLEGFARGLGAYLVGDDPDVSVPFLEQLAAAYLELGFHAEAEATLRVARNARRGDSGSPDDVRP